MIFGAVFLIGIPAQLYFSIRLFFFFWINMSCIQISLKIFTDFRFFCISINNIIFALEFRIFQNRTCPVMPQIVFLCEHHVLCHSYHQFLCVVIFTNDAFLFFYFNWPHSSCHWRWSLCQTIYVKAVWLFLVMAARIIKQPPIVELANQSIFRIWHCRHVFLVSFASGLLRI